MKVEKDFEVSYGVRVADLAFSAGSTLENIEVRLKI
jgi:hypothetical protein